MAIPNFVDNMLLWIKMAPESTPVDIVCEVCQVCCYFVFPSIFFNLMSGSRGGTGGPDPPLLQVLEKCFDKWARTPPSMTNMSGSAHKSSMHFF